MRRWIIDGILVAAVAIVAFSIMGIMRSESVYHYRYRDCVVEIKSSVRLKCRDRTTVVSEGMLTDKAQLQSLRHNASVGCIWIARVSFFGEQVVPGSLTCFLKT